MTQEMIWFLGIIAFLIIEGVTYQLVSIYLAIGAVGGLIMSLLGFGFVPQMVVFLAVSILLLCLLRPISLKMVKNRNTKTNADSLIGEKVHITKEVNNLQDCGEGRIKGNAWTVRSDDDSIIPKDSVAIVERIEGVKLIVKGK